MRFLRTAIIATTALVVSTTFAVSARAQTKRGELWFYAYCDRPTESPGDDLYLQMSVDGGEPKRLPDDLHNWSVTDNDSKRRVVKKVFEAKLKPGEEARIVLTVMERDDYLLPGFLGALAGAGQAYAKGKDHKAGPIIPILTPLIRPFAADSDDFVGAFAITLKNVDGKVELKVEAAHKDVSEEPLIVDENDRRPLPNFRARRDGTDYHIGFWEGGPRKAEPEVGELAK